MKELEISARTVDDAVEQALLELGVKREQVEVEVIKKGSRGIFGMGSEEAKVRVRLLQEAPVAGAVPAPAPAAGPEAPASEAKASDAEAMARNVAPEVLRDVLRLMKVNATVEVGPSVPGSSPTLDITGDNLGGLIGRRGQTLAALQYVVRLIVSERINKWLPIAIDVSGYKQNRREALQKLALSMADQVRATRRPVTMEPMPADERRVVHLTLADHEDVTTQSFGEGEERKVVIQLKKR